MHYWKHILTVLAFASLGWSAVSAAPIVTPMESSYTIQHQEGIYTETKAGQTKILPPTPASQQYHVTLDGQRDFYMDLPKYCKQQFTQASKASSHTAEGYPVSVYKYALTKVGETFEIISVSNMLMPTQFREKETKRLRSSLANDKNFQSLDALAQRAYLEPLLEKAYAIEILTHKFMAQQRFESVEYAPVILDGDLWIYSIAKAPADAERKNPQNTSQYSLCQYHNGTYTLITFGLHNPSPEVLASLPQALFTTRVDIQ